MKPPNVRWNPNLQARRHKYLERQEIRAFFVRCMSPKMALPGTPGDREGEPFADSNRTL
jgi:hypothetical protein